MLGAVRCPNAWIQPKKPLLLLLLEKREGRNEIYLLSWHNKHGTEQRTKSRSLKFLVNLLTESLPFIFVKQNCRMSSFLIHAVMFSTKEISKPTPEVAALQCYMKQILQQIQRKFVKQKGQFQLKTMSGSLGLLISRE